MKHKLEDRRKEKRSDYRDDTNVSVFIILLVGLFIFGLSLTESVYI